MRNRAIQHEKFGHPPEVARLVQLPEPTRIEESEVLIRWLAAPINPLDINKIQGAYMIKPQLPTTVGSEGVGRVEKVGSAVTRVRVGDHVVLFSLNCPTWSDYAVVEEEYLYAIDKRAPILGAATLMVNPPTALVMLKMGQLQEGDWVVQNSANSGVGRAVIQIAKVKGYHTINIVRNRPDIAALKAELTSMGGDVVLTEEEVLTEGRKFRGKPKLALNGVGGKSSRNISSMLERGGLMVTYGGMSKQPHEVTTSALVFNDIRCAGIAVGLWMNDHKEEFEAMLKELEGMLVDGSLTAPPMQEQRLENYKEALEFSMDGKHPKQVFILERADAKL